MSDAEPQNFATSASMSSPTRPASSGADPSKTKWAVWIPIIVSISGLVGGLSAGAILNTLRSKRNLRIILKLVRQRMSAF